MNQRILKFGPYVLVSFISGLLGATLFSGLSGDNISSFNGKPAKIIEQKTYVEESEATNAIEKAAPAVMSIVATKDLQTFRQNPFDLFYFNDPFFEQFGFPFGGQPQQRRGQGRQEPQQQEPETKRQTVAGGTGFIVRDDGFALTNKHVVNDKDADYLAILPSGKEYDVEILSIDPLNDLAVVQLHEKVVDANGRKTGEKKNFGAKPSKLPVVELGDSSQVKVGQRVFAIGYARGEYENSVTAGIVSATGRQIQASDQGGGFRETLSNLIQTDAAINFGNSGGPLINLAGQVVGINTAIDAAASGIGFAIPANEVKAVLSSIETHGKIVRPLLGVRHVILNKETAEQYGLSGVEYGALISGDRTKGETPIVPGSPAEKAGLRVDDVILEVDGEKVTDKHPLQAIIRGHQPNDTLRLKVWRSGSTFETTVKLDELKEPGS